jgi:hypothetical protein
MSGQSGPPVKRSSPLGHLPEGRASLDLHVLTEAATGSTSTTGR